MTDFYQQMLDKRAIRKHNEESIKRGLLIILFVVCIGIYIAVRNYYFK